MWISDNWTEYEILDASSGEKLERWGDIILVRPDPQAIWRTPKRHPGWDKAHARYIRSSSGGGSWEFYKAVGEWKIKYRNFTFALKPFSFKHTGLFPEQACNWDYIRDRIKRPAPAHQRNPEKAPLRVLNLFAYTGAATIAAASVGASVVHVDASKGMLAWAKENASSCGLSEANVRWLVDDCVGFVEREIRRGSKYDAIILDPPSYGRGPKGEIWKFQDMIFNLMQKIEIILSDSPVFIVLNSYTAGLSYGTLSYIMQETVVNKRGGVVFADELGLPVTGTNLIVPCGSSARWQPNCLCISDGLLHL